MDHVTDERTDRPLDRELHHWLERSIEELPDGSELPPAIRADVLRRLPSTPQRRRWWPFRWFPFGSGATRSADREEPHHEGRPRSMFSATRVAAGVAILALAGSLALVANPVGDRPVAPGAEATPIDPGAFGGFTGSMSCEQGEEGTTTLTEWGSIVEGETYPRCDVEVSDSRFSGNNYSVHDYYKYGGVPPWGVRSNSSVITNEGGSWVGEQGWGYQHPEHGAMRYVGIYRGPASMTA